MNIRKILTLSALLLPLVLTSKAFPHSYHYEIQVSNTLQINKQLEALTLTFLYDEPVSKAMLQDQKDLETLGTRLITDLKTLGYFTQIKLNGKVLSTNKAENTSLKKIKANDVSGKAYDALQLQFTLPLQNPINISSKSEIELRHEDPTEAAILYYDNADHLLITGQLKESCKSSVKEKGDFTEGEFPQIVKVTCNP